MIKIDKIEIKNYKSCLKTSFNLISNLNVLIGVNGVGKSNILNAIQLLKKIKYSIYKHDFQDEDSILDTTITIYINIENEIHLLKATIFYFIDDRNIDEVFAFDIKIKPLNKEKTSTKWKTLNYYKFNTLFDKINDKSDRVGWLIFNFFNSISYYGATQFADPSKCPISIEFEDSRATRTNRNLKAHDKFIQDLYLLYKKDSDGFNQYLNTVNKSGISLVDSIDFFEHEMPINSYVVKQGGKISPDVRYKTIIIPKIKIDNIDLTLNQLSEGTFKTLALVFYILSDKSELLLIEEPEVCIHHGLLNSIIELIKIQSKNKQIIISTHSDLILDQLEPENILLVNKQLSKGTIATPLNNHLSEEDLEAMRNYLRTSGNLGEYWKEGGFDNE